MGEWTDVYGSKASKKKEYIGKITNFFSNISVAEIKIETGNISFGDEILIMGETTGVYEDFLDEIRVDLQSVDTAKKGEYCSIKTKSIVRRGDKVYKYEKNLIKL
jgi:putative protease